MRIRQRDGQWVTTITVVDQGGFDGGPIDFGDSYKDGSLERVIISFLAARDEIPREFWASARCEIDSVSSYEDSHYAHVLITYERPATLEEIAAIQAAEKRRVEEERARELRMLADLKAKYDKA